MQQISFDGMTAHTREIKFANYDLPPTSKTVKLCPDCHKSCKTKRGCLITQIQNEINKERTNDKIEYMAVHMKFPKSIPDEDVHWALSTAKDGKRRTGYPFSKAIFGMVKPK